MIEVAVNEDVFATALNGSRTKVAESMTEMIKLGTKSDKSGITLIAFMPASIEDVTSSAASKAALIAFVTMLIKAVPTLTKVEPALIKVEATFYALVPLLFFFGLRLGRPASFRACQR